MATVTLYGNLGTDGQLLSTRNNSTALKLRVAEHKRKPDEGEDAEDEETVWWDVLVWQPMASTLLPMMQRGVRVTVQGRLDVRTWTDAEGAVRLNRTIIADAVGWQSKRKRDTVEDDPDDARPVEPTEPVASDEDPFGDQ